MTKLNKALLASTAIAFASGLALPAFAQDPAEAPAVVKSRKNMKLRLYGQIARHFGFVSDGTNQQFRQGQNPNTSSRMGIDGRGKINKDWSLRTRFEFQLVGDTGLDPQENQDGDRERFRIRHTDAIFSNKRLGAIWIGRGDAASNGTSEVDLVPGGATGHLGGSLHQAAQGVGVRDEDTGARIGEVPDFFNGYDGAGRATRIRYDTPSFGGFKASASYIDATSYDAALRYSGGMGGSKVRAAVGFTRIESAETGNFADYGGDQVDTYRLNGSFSVGLAGGFGVTMSGAHEWNDADGRDDEWNVNPSIWYTMKASELGPTSLEVSYQHTENRAANDTSGDAFAVSMYQVLSSVGTDTYLTFRYYDVDAGAIDTDEVWVIGAGFRARF
jgi:hypothetical protein